MGGRSARPGRHPGAPRLGEDRDRPGPDQLAGLLREQARLSRRLDPGFDLVALIVEPPLLPSWWVLRDRVAIAVARLRSMRMTCAISGLGDREEKGLAKSCPGDRRA